MNNERPPSRVTPRMLRALTCPRRYQIEYVHNYRLKGRRPWPWPPSMKTLLHVALLERDFHRSSRRVGLRGKISVENVLQVYQDQLKKVRGVVGFDEAIRSDREIDELVDDARRILGHYDDVHGEPWSFAKDAMGRPIVDALAEYELPSNPETSTWIYTDRIDGIVLRKELPPAVLVRRFTSTTDPLDVQRNLALAFELIGPMWCASQLYNKPVTSAVVDVVRTKPPSIPDTVKCRKCGGQGSHEKGQKNDDGTWTPTKCEACSGTGIGGMSKSPCDTTLDIWNSTVTGLGLQIREQVSRCEQTVRRLEERGESFAHRIVVDIPLAAFEQWEQDVIATADLVLHHTKKNYWPRNTAACIGRSGPCPYRKVCSHHGTDDVAWFTRIDDPYPGLD